MWRGSATETSQSINSSASDVWSGGLPIVRCPECGGVVKKLVSRTNKNPGRVFYKCMNSNMDRTSKCRFFMWANEYEELLRRIGVHDVRTDSMLHAMSRCKDVLHKFKMEWPNLPIMSKLWAKL